MVKTERWLSSRNEFSAAIGTDTKERPPRCKSSFGGGGSHGESHIARIPEAICLGFPSAAEKYSNERALTRTSMNVCGRV